MYTQPAGNEAAQQQAGAGEASSGSLLDADVSSVLAWMWDGALEAVGFGTEEPEDSWDFASQTTQNVLNALARLDEVATLAEKNGETELAETVRSAAGRFGEAAGLATDIKNLVDVQKKLLLVEKLADTTLAVVAVDMRDPAAAETFDEWFATLGEAGEEICKAGGMWGAALMPFATFVKMFGEYDLFSAVKRNMGPHGMNDPDDAGTRALYDAEH